MNLSEFCSEPEALDLDRCLKLIRPNGGPFERVPDPSKAELGRRTMRLQRSLSYRLLMIQSVPSPGCSDQNNRRLVRENGKQTSIYSKIAEFRTENAANHVPPLLISAWS